jgi:hypothetical protein
MIPLDKSRYVCIGARFGTFLVPSDPVFSWKTTISIENNIRSEISFKN